MKTFRHGGKIGDVIYSLPTIRELGGGILYLPERTPDACINLYSSLRDLLLQQPYIKEVREYPSDLSYMELAPGVHIDYDLDRARLQPLKGIIHIVKRYMDAFGVNYPNWKEPWLKTPGYADEKRLQWYGLPKEYCLINYTARHITNEQLKITSKVDWNRVLETIQYPVFFVGHDDECINFCKRYEFSVPLVRTKNIFQLARLIKDAKAIYCNQSSVLALSQSLGKTYYLEPKPMKRNCLLYTNNENILQ